MVTVMNNDKSKALTRADLSETIHRKVGVSLSEAAELVDTTIEEVCKALENEELVKISSFGTFHVRRKNRAWAATPKPRSR